MVFVAGVTVQFVLLTLAKGTVALFAGVITLGLLLCFVQNAVLLRRIRKCRVGLDPPVPE